MEILKSFLFVLFTTGITILTICNLSGYKVAARIKIFNYETLNIILNQNLFKQNLFSLVINQKTGISTQ